MARKNEIDENKEDTLNLHVSEERINDAESLDTSFLDGRAQKKVVKNSREKEKILKESGHSFDVEKFFKVIGYIIFLQPLLLIPCLIPVS